MNLSKNEIARIANLWIPNVQRSVINGLLRGEEGKWFSDKLREIAEIVTKMPKSYENQESDPVAYIRYFATNGWEWFITEKDMAGDQPGEDHEQAFGYVRGWENEFGYISIPELRAIAGVEIDLHFTPKRISELPPRN